MAAAVMRVRARRREQRVQEDIDVAHRDALLPDKVERVVEHAFDVRQMGFLDLLVLGHHPEGIDQQSPAAQLAPAPGGDAPELAARVDGDRGALEPPVTGRQQVKGDESAPCRRGAGPR